VDYFRAGDSGMLSVMTENKRLTRLFSGERAAIRPKSVVQTLPNLRDHLCDLSERAADSALLSQ